MSHLLDAGVFLESAMPILLDTHLHVLTPFSPTERIMHCYVILCQYFQFYTVLFALSSLNHQSRPVQYTEIGRLIEAITNRFSELSFPSRVHYRSSVSELLLLYVFNTVLKRNASS